MDCKIKLLNWNFFNKIIWLEQEIILKKKLMKLKIFILIFS